VDFEAPLRLRAFVGRWLLGRRLLRRRLLGPSLWGGRLLSGLLLVFQPRIPFAFQFGGKLQIFFAELSFCEHRRGGLSLGLGGFSIQRGGTLIGFSRLLVGDSDSGFRFFLDLVHVGATESGALV